MLHDFIFGYASVLDEKLSNFRCEFERWVVDEEAVEVFPDIWHLRQNTIVNGVLCLTCKSVVEVLAAHIPLGPALSLHRSAVMDLTFYLRPKPLDPIAAK